MTKRRFAAVVGLLLIVAACGGDATNDTVQGQATSTTSPVLGDPEAYCTALAEMIASQPPEGAVNDQFAADMEAYAGAVERAAAQAPGDQAGALVEFADFLRDTATDPTAAGTTERAFGLLGVMLQIQLHAQNECGLDVEEAPDREALPTTPPRQFDVEIDAGLIEAANSAVPEGVELRFDAIETPDAEYPVLALAPAGWAMDEFFGFTFEPPENTEFGFFTEMSVGDGCDGICAPQDWSKIMDDLDLGPFALIAGDGEILLDIALTNPLGRIVVYQDDEAFNPVVVIGTRWSDKADKYFKCEVRLDEGDEALWRAFAAACEASIPLWIPIN